MVITLINECLIKTKNTGRIKVISSGQNKMTPSKMAGKIIHMVGHVRAYSSSYTHRNTRQPITKPCAHARVDTTMERWTVMISWLIATSFLFLSSLG